MYVKAVRCIDNDCNLLLKKKKKKTDTGFAIVLNYNFEGSCKG